MPNKKNTNVMTSTPTVTSRDSVTSISPEQLKGAPEFEVVPPATPTETPALQAQLDTPTDYTKGLQDKATAAQTTETKSMEDLLASMLDTKGETQLTTEAYDKQGVDKLTKELNKYDQQLNVEKNALTRQIERIQDNQEGMSDTQIVNRVAEVERQSLRKQADISVIRAGVAQDYSTAKAIADRAVSVQLERDKIKNEALQKNYDRNKSLFDKAEQRAFESAQADRERAYTKEENTLKFISDISIEAMKMGAGGDVITAIRNAKTPKEAQSIASEFMKPIIEGERSLDNQLKQAQLAKARERTEKLAPRDVIDQNGRKLLINTDTGEVIKDFGAGEATTGEMKTALAKDFVTTVDALKTDPGMSRAVGAYGIARFTPFTPDQSAVNNFTASLEQMSTTLTLNNLIDAKARGATFGALSIPELNMLAQSATKINSWARNENDEKVNPETDVVHHYAVSEKTMKQELDKISNFGKLDYILKGGNPNDIGVQKMDDGSYWAQNSDGSLTKIR